MSNTIKIRGKYVEVKVGDKTDGNPFVPLHVQLDPSTDPGTTKVAHTEWVEVERDYDKELFERFAKSKTPDGMVFVELEEQEDENGR